MPKPLTHPRERHPTQRPPLGKSTRAPSPALYGAPRPKSKPIPLSSTSIHALSTELALAKSAASSSVDVDRPKRPKRNSLFTAASRANAGVEARKAKDEDAAANYHMPGSSQQMALMQRRLEQKAKLYAKMKRGEEISAGLVDFDRKWAEQGSGAEEEEEEEVEDEEEETVEYEDEFGRTRTGTKSEAERVARQREFAASELAASKAHSHPERVIYGNTIQTAAIQTVQFGNRAPNEEDILKLEKLDTDTRHKHYDADTEVRTKGVGFYQFSKKEDERREQMENLMKEREDTMRMRKERDEKKKRKREEVEARKEAVRAKRRGKIGESWLEGMGFGELEADEGEKGKE